MSLLDKLLGGIFAFVFTDHKVACLDNKIAELKTNMFFLSTSCLR